MSLSLRLTGRRATTVESDKRHLTTPHPRCMTAFAHGPPGERGPSSCEPSPSSDAAASGTTALRRAETAAPQLACSAWVRPACHPPNHHTNPVKAMLPAAEKALHVPGPAHHSLPQQPSPPPQGPPAVRHPLKAAHTLTLLPRGRPCTEAGIALPESPRQRRVQVGMLSTGQKPVVSPAAIQGTCQLLASLPVPQRGRYCPAL